RDPCKELSAPGPRASKHRQFVNCFFFFYCYGDHRDLLSFPTRRSSDLAERFEDAAAELAALKNLEVGVQIDVTAHRLVDHADGRDRKSTRLNSSHVKISYAVFCLKKKMSLRFNPDAGFARTSSDRATHE